AFEVHSDGIDVDNELFHYPIKKAYTLTFNSNKPFALTKYCIKCLRRF
ncbi:hypothetical protein ACUN9W_12960, partial [Escherichia coli]